jgi:TATA-binding protein-associated factor
VISANFPETQYLRLDGKTPMNKRFEICTEFNTNIAIRLLLITTKTGGLGLNLQAASVVIFVDHSWNPVADLQAMDRAHRLGQKKVVNVYRLITRDTFEEEVLGLQAFKTKIAESLVNAENSTMSSVDSFSLLDSINHI